MSNGNYHLNGWFERLGERRTFLLCGLAALAILTYLPFLGLPPLQDDYSQMDLAERYGRPGGWFALLQDPLYRCRATSILFTAATVELFGWSILVFNLSSMALHALNVLLIAALGRCRWIGWPVSFVAAFVFAVRERHHEAVVWYASVHEPLVLLFSLLAVLSLIRWLEGGSRAWLAAVGVAWLAALASKESGVALAAVLPALAWLYPDRRRAALPLVSLGAVITGAYFLLAYGQRTEHQHFNDGTFSFSSQLFRTVLNSAVRGLWIWGGLSLAAIAVYRAKVDLRLLTFGAAWFIAGLIPYSFLTYMPRIPSRHHYVASVGSALIVACGFWALIQTRRRAALLAGVLATAFVAHNWTYLWTTKRAQFAARAELIEGFVDFVKEHPDSPVLNQCSELNTGEAKRAVRYRLGSEAESFVTTGQSRTGIGVYSCPVNPGS